MEVRIKEIFTIIYNSLKDNNLANDVKHCVISGSGFNMINKVDKTAEAILNTSVRFWNAKTANLIKPACITSYGIVKYISNIKYTKNLGSRIQEDEEQSIFDSTFKNIKKAFSGAFARKKK